MKTKDELKIRILSLSVELEELKAEHRVLHQIDMLSAEGSELRDKISRTKGMIQAFQEILYE